MTTPIPEYTVVVFDDERSFRSDVSFMHPTTVRLVYVRTVSEMLDYLSHLEGGIDELYLDHDLGIDPCTNKPVTIAPVVDFLCEHLYNLRIGKIFVHSMNPVVNSQVMAPLVQAGYSVHRTLPANVGLVV